jgi:predicted dithiol-disulfide oxidoreductase (DUF899 family)
MKSDNLTAAPELAAKNRAHFPNESAAYREARNQLLVEELELRRQLERVAAKRRALPPGGEVTKAYRFDGEDGSVSFAELFGSRDTLIVYSYMFGPARKKPCPMCTSFIGTWDHKMADIEQRVSFVVTARSPIERLVAAKKERGWSRIRVFSDPSGEYTRDYVNAEDADVPGYSVFSRGGGVIRHFWSGEFSGEMSDPGQDPRGAPDFDPLWNLLDTTPEGRGKDWYPSLEYPTPSR